MSTTDTTNAGFVEKPEAAPWATSGKEAIPDLVNRCKAGDQAAFKQLFDESVAGVHRHLSLMLGPEPDIDDLVQVVFLNVFNAIKDFKGSSSFSTWLFRITINVANQEIRLRGRRRRLRSALAEEGYVRQSSTNHTPELEMHVQQQIYEILDQLPVKKRETYILFMYEGYSLEEISVLVGSSVSTIGARLQSARREIVKLLERRKP